MAITINIFDFFDDARGVKRIDSKWSAESLREDILIPKINKRKKNEKIYIIIDDINEFNGYGSSFLKEAFVGLFSYGHVEYNDFIENFIFKSVDRANIFYISQISRYAEQWKNKEDLK